MIGEWPWSHRLRPLVSVLVRTALLHYEACYGLRHLLHQQTFTPNDVYNRRPFLHTRNRMTKNLYTRSLLHQRQFEPKSFYTRNILHQTTSTTECEYTRNLIHLKELYTRKRLTRGTLFTPENLFYIYTTRLHQKTLYIQQKSSATFFQQPSSATIFCSIPSIAYHLAAVGVGDHLWNSFCFLWEKHPSSAQP